MIYETTCLALRSFLCVALRNYENSGSIGAFWIQKVKINNIKLNKEGAAQQIRRQNRLVFVPFRKHQSQERSSVTLQNPRVHTLTQFDSTQESGIFIQGHGGWGARNQQLQMVSHIQLDNTWRNTNVSSAEVCSLCIRYWGHEKGNVPSAERVSNMQKQTTIHTFLPAIGQLKVTNSPITQSQSIWREPMQT